MLGFNAISEVSIAELPGAFVPVSSVTPQNIGITSALGSVTTEGQGAADVTGVSATLVLGTEFSITGTANVSITGLSAIGELGNETVWGLIIPAPGNSYTNITTGASQTWTEITTGASQTWTDVIQ